MKRYRLIYRGNRDAYYCFDTHTKKRESLGINDAAEAQRLLDARNEAVRHLAMNLQIAQVYLQHSDPTLATRTWQNVMDTMVPLKTGATQSRWVSAMRDKAFDLIRNRKLMETTSEEFLQVLNAGTVSTNMFLRPPSQLRDRDALASLASPAEASLARSAAQGTAGDYI